MGVTGAINAIPQPGMDMQAVVNAQAGMGQQPALNAQSAYTPQYDMYGNVINNGQYNQYDQYGNGMQITPGMYQDASSPMQVTPDIHLGMTQDIMGQAFGTGVWSAAELQNQLGNEVREAMGYYPQDNTYNTGNVAYGANTGNIQYGTDTGNISYTGATDSMPYAESSEPNVYAQIPSESDKLSGIKVEPVIPEISVNTGVIDISEADLSLLNNALPGEKLQEDELSADALPGDSLPDDELSGADLPGGPLTDDDDNDLTDDAPVEINSSTDDILSALDGIIPGTGVKSIAQTGVSSSVNVHKTVSRITGQIPSFLPSAADVNANGAKNASKNESADEHIAADDKISESKEEDYA
ncbi:MAG: hypothetical protein HUJ62_02560 [Streptococcus gallolyticus]|nr:hypothetical protein [Streptococcus gallolyticus]